MTTPTAPRPWVTVKYAQTLDGRIATCTGDGARRISGAGSLELAHRIRAEHQAILVGVQTVIADDPLLTVRLVEGVNPLRVVADSAARVPLQAALLTDEAPSNTLIACTERAPRKRLDMLERIGAQTLTLPADEDGRVDLEALLAALAARGVETLMVEGGAGIITGMLRRRLVDRLMVCIAPKLIGAGIEAVGDLRIRKLSQAITFRDVRISQIGDDMVFEGTVAGRDDSSQPFISRE